MSTTIRIECELRNEMSNGKVRYELNTPYRDGITHVIFEPMDFIARFVARVAKPRVNLTRLHGVFAPNSAHRARVTAAKRDNGNKAGTSPAPEDSTLAERRLASMGSINALSSDSIE